MPESPPTHEPDLRESRAAVLPLAEGLARLPGRGGPPFAELLRHGTLSVEIFRPRGVDTQQPHPRDEIYVVANGSADFVYGSQRRRVEPGHFLFVPAGLPHRFENFTGDLTLWVIFYGPEGGERP
jgi:mannose-6-phosphate isomerase-like protein (cupin superfamily)